MIYRLTVIKAVNLVATCESPFNLLTCSIAYISLQTVNEKFGEKEEVYGKKAGRFSSVQQKELI